MFGPKHTFASALRMIVEGLESGEIVLSEADVPPKPIELKIELTLTPEANPEDVMKKVSRLIDLLDQYDKAAGGSGIQFDPNRSRSQPGKVTLVVVSNAWDERGFVLQADLARIPGVTTVEIPQAA